MRRGIDIARGLSRGDCAAGESVPDWPRKTIFRSPPLSLLAVRDRMFASAGNVDITLSILTASCGFVSR
jgi:hypothetical protein